MTKEQKDECRRQYQRIYYKQYYYDHKDRMNESSRKWHAKKRREMGIPERQKGINMEPNTKSVVLQIDTWQRLKILSTQTQRTIKGIANEALQIYLKEKEQKK